MQLFRIRGHFVIAASKPAAIRAFNHRNKGNPLMVHEAVEELSAIESSGPAKQQRIVCFVSEFARADDGGYLACFCKEDESGYWATDWNWGTDRDIAQGFADGRNEVMGMTPQEAAVVQMSTMRKRR